MVLCRIIGQSTDLRAQEACSPTAPNAQAQKLGKAQSRIYQYLFKVLTDYAPRLVAGQGTNLGNQRVSVISSWSWFSMGYKNLRRSAVRITLMAQPTGKAQKGKLDRDDRLSNGQMRGSMGPK